MIYFGFKVTRNNLPLIIKLNKGRKPTEKELREPYFFVRAARVYRNKDIRRDILQYENWGTITYDYVEYYFIILDEENPITPMPRWMNCAHVRTCSYKRWAGRRTNKPTFGWSKRRKKQHRMGYVGV